MTRCVILLEWLVVCVFVCRCVCTGWEREIKRESEPVIWSGVVPFVIRKPGITVGHEFSISSEILRSHLHNTSTWCDRHKCSCSCCILLQSAETRDSKTAATDNRSHIQEELPVTLHFLSAEEAQLLCVCVYALPYMS